MTFGEKLLQLRKARHLSQKEVAKVIGVTSRSFTDYERGVRYPRTRNKYEALAKFFDVDVNYLYTENEFFIDEAGKKYGSRGRRQANALVNELAGLFAGGELSNEDKDAVMLDLQRVYWVSKEQNKKYTPKKYKDG